MTFIMNVSSLERKMRKVIKKVAGKLLFLDREMNPRGKFE